MFEMSRQLKGALMAEGGGVCWGISGTMGQYLFTHEAMQTTWLIPIRLGLAGLILIHYFGAGKPSSIGFVEEDATRPKGDNHGRTVFLQITWVLDCHLFVGGQGQVEYAHYFCAVDLSHCTADEAALL